MAIVKCSVVPPSPSWPGSSRPSTFFDTARKTWMPGTRPGITTCFAALIDRPDQGLDLVRVRAELLGELVEIGIGDRGKALFVDIVDDLDAERFQLRGCGLFKLKGFGRLFGADLRRCRRHPLLLFARQALPQFVAD